MADRFDPSRPAPAEPYSPRRRTALVLTGTGTAGAYHAGVLRALHEAGVKLDIVAGRGIGVVGALFAAIEGGQRLWDEAGFWRAPVVGSLYRWRAALQLTAWTLALAVAIVAVPIAAVALGAIVFPIDFLARMMGTDGASGLVDIYLRLAQSAFAPEGFPTWLPRLVVLVLGGAGLIMAVSGAIAGNRRTERGGFWWRAVRSPLGSSAAAEHCWRMMWDLVRGAAQLKQPTRTELGRRYTELLVDNLGQPGFRELLIAVHDLDAHRDLVFALVAETRRRDLIRRPTTDAADARRAEVIDLAGVGREYLADAVAAALSVPVVTDVHVLTFTPEAYCRC